MNRIIILSSFLLLLLATSSYAQWPTNNTLSLNGTNAYYSFPDHADINPTTAVTFEFSIYLPALPSAVVAVIGKNYAASYAIGIYTTGGLFMQTPSGLAASTGLLTAGVWNHVAITYSAGSTAFYINGATAGTSTGITGTIPTTTDSLFIGCDRNAGVPSNFLNGQLKNVRIWKDVVRTQAQIQQNRYINLSSSGYQTNSAYDGLTFSLSFGIFSQFDMSGTLQIGNSRGGATLLPYFNKPTQFCDYNNTVYFDGASWIASPNRSQYNATSAVTIEAWVKRDTTGSQNSFGTILCKSGNTTSWAYALYINSAGALFFSLNTDGGYIVKTNAITLGRWYHVAGTYSQASGIMKLYINGDSVLSGSYSAAIQNQSDSVGIGSFLATGYTSLKFKGQIDCPRIWADTVVPSAGIKLNMYRNLAVNNVSVNKVTEFSLDGDNIPHTNGNSFSTGNAYFRGLGAFYTSSHVNNNAYLVSPILRDDANGFYSSNYFISTNRFFIPDANATGVADSIYVPPAAGGNITKLRAFVLMNHTFVGDMTLTLRGPQGQEAVLVPTAFSTGNNDLMTVFDDLADSSLTNAALIPFSPRVKPSDVLSIFNGTNCSGYWRLTFVDNVGGDIGYVSGWGVQPTIVTGNNNNTETPNRFFLAQNFPNPFNPTTTIKYGIATDSRVKITIYDILGKEVQTLVNELKKAGSYQLTFNASSLSSGVYFYKIEAGDFVETKKLTLIK